MKIKLNKWICISLIFVIFMIWQIILSQNGMAMLNIFKPIVIYEGQESDEKITACFNYKDYKDLSYEYLDKLIKYKKERDESSKENLSNCIISFYEFIGKNVDSSTNENTMKILSVDDKGTEDKLVNAKDDMFDIYFFLIEIERNMILLKLRFV